MGKKLKQTDFQIKRGIEPLQFQRGATINEKHTVLTVTLKLNWKKGQYTIHAKWDWGQVVGDDKLNQTTVTLIGELMMAAKSHAENWLRQWKEDNPSDPDQLSMGFEDEAEPATDKE